ncbi:unnamed protein product [Triticum turgidum subsp. durum]|uniref:Ferritin n=1 Tax=Triticum turgidum subsp. durum TaxID=4567 RepID=A0A9R0X5H0_TRITD|nr:unnamed protein product [Triticum turgidum subsp. durum]
MPRTRITPSSPTSTATTLLSRDLPSKSFPTHHTTKFGPVDSLKIYHYSVLMRVCSCRFFKESSDEERGHAEKLMEYQNKRGGRVRLQSIVTPLTEFDHPEKGDALYAMELALALEKLVNEKLHNLHSVATRCNDPQLTDFVESEFLQEQVDAIKKISEYVSQLRRVGKGHGVWHFDQMLLEEAA